MIPENIDAVSTFIDVLSQRLAVPAAQLFEIVERIGARTAVNFYLSISTFVASLVLAIVFSYVGTKNRMLDGPMSALTMFLILISMISFLFVIGTSIDYIFWTIDSKAWAINYILDNFLGAK